MNTLIVVLVSLFFFYTGYTKKTCLPIVGGLCILVDLLRFLPSDLDPNTALLQKFAPWAGVALAIWGMAEKKYERH